MCSHFPQVAATLTPPPLPLSSPSTVMNTRVLALLAVAVLASYAEAVLVLGTVAAGTTVGVGAATAGVALAGLGGLVLGAGLGGLLAHSHRRGKRSVQEAAKEETVFNLVSTSDTYGCALKLVCLLEAKPEEQLGDDDQFILNIFG